MLLSLELKLLLLHFSRRKQRPRLNSPLPECQQEVDLIQRLQLFVCVHEAGGKKNERV